MSQRWIKSDVAREESLQAMLRAYATTGRADQFAIIVAQFGSLVYAECMRVTRNAHDAEDAAQLTFLAFAIELRSGTTVLRPFAWLQRVARRQSLKIVRSRGRRKRREIAVSLSIESTEPPMPSAVDEDALTAERVREAIDALPERHRLPLVLHYFGGLSLEAIAAELNITRTAAGTRLHRARKSLANELSTRGLTFDAGTLTRVMSILVPTAVVTNLVASSAVSPGVPPAGLSASVGLMLRATEQFTLPRAVIVAVIGLFAGGTAMGWQPLPKLVQLVKERIHFAPIWNDFWDNLLHTTDGLSLPRMESAPLGPLTNAMPAFPNATAPMAFESTWPSLGHATHFDTIDLPRSSIVSRFDSPASTSARTTTFASTRYELSPTAATSGTADYTLAPIGAQFNTPFTRATAEMTRSPFRASSGARDSGDATPVMLRLPGVAQIALAPGAMLDLDRIELGIAQRDRTRLIQAGGEVNTDRLVIGQFGQGEYLLRNGGTLQTRQLTLGEQVGSSGMLDVGHGIVRMINPIAPIEIGARGIGELRLGSRDGPGQIHLGGGPQSNLVIRSDSRAAGVLRGWGEVAGGDTLINNGRVVADGNGDSRTLNLSGFHAVRNTIENPRDGTNGWYAENGGSLQLPTIPVKPGNSTVTWGEDDDDKEIDLVNSVRVTIINQPTPAKLDIILRSIASLDSLNVTPPEGTRPITAWQFTSVGALTPDRMSFTIRYDAAAVSAQVVSNREMLQLVGHNGSGWSIAQLVFVDENKHQISGSFLGSVSYLIVGTQMTEFYPGTRSTLLTSRSVYPTPNVIVITPEPGGLFGLAVLFFAGRRRRIQR